MTPTRLAKVGNYIMDDIANAERWLKEIIEVRLTSGRYGGTPFDLHFDVVTYQQARPLGE